MIQALLLLWLITAQNDSPRFEGVDAAGKTVVGSIRKSEGMPAVLVDPQGKSHPLHSFKSASSGSEPPTEIAAPLLAWWTPADHLPSRPPTIDSDDAMLETPVGSFVIPRNRLRRIELSGNGRVVFHESFPGSLDRWKLEGEVGASQVRARSPQRSLMLSRPGQRARIDLPHGVTGGHVTFWFFDEGGVAAGTRWTAKLAFKRDKQAHAIRLIGGWDRPAYVVEFDQLSLACLPAARRTGWRQATLAFGKDKLLITIDGAALVSHFGPIPLLPLASIEFDLQSVTANAPSPSVWIDDLQLVEESAPAPSDLADPTQTVIVDRQGDAWHGDLISANSERIEFRLAGERSAPVKWSDIHSATFADAEANSVRYEGEIGRLRLRPAGEFTAALLSIDARQWRVRNPVLGDVTIPEAKVAEWRPELVGSRTELLSAPVHLGNRLVDTFHRPLPDATSLSKAFEPVAGDLLDNARLCAWVIGMEGEGADSPFAGQLKAGRLRTMVWINGVEVDYFNRLIEHRTDEPIRVCLPLPKGVVKPGRNVVELRQTADPNTGYYDEAEIYGLAVEFDAR